MAGGLLISLYIYDELSYDKMFPDAEQIYRLNADIKFGGAENKVAVVPAPMADVLVNDFPQVEATTRFRTIGSTLLKKSGTIRNVKLTGTTYADPSFLDFFGIDLLLGDKATVLKDPNMVVLTKSAAEKFFSIDEAVGQTLIFDSGDTFTVSAVIDDLPRNSLLSDYTLFIAMAGYADAKIPNWGTHNYNTFVKLSPLSESADFEEGLPYIVDTYVLTWAQTVFPGMTKEQFDASGNYIRYSTIPLTDIHLHSHRKGEMNANNSIQNIYILSFIALFLIVLASVNFMNLSTAGSLKRAKEVGIRKTLGSNRSTLIGQFLTESGLISFASLLAALGLTLLLMPYFNDLSNKQLSIPFLEPYFWLTIIVATVILGLLSGSYPAFFLSRFAPIKVLSGSGSSAVGGGKLRNGLVVFQFAISVFLIVATLVVYGQLQFIQQKDLGYKKEQVLILNDVYALGAKSNLLKKKITELPQVSNATLSAYFPTPSSRSDNSFFEEGISDQEKALSMQTWDVDHDYVSTFNLDIIAGRDFDYKRSADSSAMLINEATLKVLGISAEEVLGKRFSSNMLETDHEYYTVIGVINDFHFESLRESITPLSLVIGKNPGSLAIKLNAGDFPQAIAQIEATWTQLAPALPFNYYFMDASFNDTYQSDQRLGRLFVIFTVLSILVACLGLFGLAAFNAEKRTKEIGIRKVMGASVGQISFKLSIDFLKLVGLAVLISLPLGWYAMNKWLEDFSYKIEISWWVLALAAFLAVGIALATISYQSIKAALTNPVNSLRSE
ncbi:ABC transporter permease [Cyclobacterium qasimii]|nr:ABC transporter permease [Cyclobacterium qasimii]